MAADPVPVGSGLNPLGVVPDHVPPSNGKTDPPRILLIDPDRVRRARLSQVLGSWAVPHRLQESDRMPMDLLSRDDKATDLVLIHLVRHPTGPELAEVKAVAARLPVVVVGPHEPELTLQALDLGVQDYLDAAEAETPALGRAVTKALERHHYLRELLTAVENQHGRSKAVDSINEIGRLREMNEFKTNLLNTAAHELSTPLTPIRFQTAILKASPKEGMQPNQIKAIEVLDRNVERLSKLVHDLLDVARLEARQFSIKVQPTDLSQIARESADAFRELARQAHVTLNVETTPELAVEADPQRVAQIFFNLLSNALKFTPGGGTVTLTTREEDSMAVASVTDTGIGLKSADFGKLFQPFSQIQDADANTPRRPGTGLGLYISHGIVEQHGGRIWCDSEGVGKGSTFAFAIPVRQKDAARSRAMVSRIADASGRHPKRHGAWPFIHFSCPMCKSRDIDMRIIRNTYECNRCQYVWR